MNPWHADQLEQRPIGELLPYARNARTHSDAQVAQIAASIAEFGFVNPILVGSDNTLIAGHGRLMAARKLGLDTVPVLVLDHLSDTQRRALIIADNKLAENAGWDDEMLALELAELQDSDFNLEVLGFDDTEISEILSGVDGDDEGDGSTRDTDGEPPEETDEDLEPQGPVIARLGDIWQLGEHRLICGSSTDPEVVSALMNGERAKLLFTSPPYANQRHYTTGGIDNWDTLMQGVFGAAINEAMAEDGQVLVNLGLVHREGEWLPYWDDWIKWMKAQRWRPFGWYVWDQGVTVPGDWAGRMAPRHEFIFHFNRQARKPNKIVECKHAGQKLHLRADGSADNGLRNADGGFHAWTHFNRETQDMRIPDSVITVTRQRGRIGEGIDHPAVFPIGLPKFVMESFTDPGEVVFEPFSGSGTTILAAEQCGRKACASELAPEYVDVALKRWSQHHPGREPVLVETGQTWSEVFAEREPEALRAAA